MLHPEPEMLGIERDGASHIVHLVGDAVGLLMNACAATCEGVACGMVTLLRRVVR